MNYGVPIRTREEPSVYNILGRTSHADSFTGIDALVFVSTEW